MLENLQTDPTTTEEATQKLESSQETAAGGSDTDPPKTTKTAGLDEYQPELPKAKGSDTDVKDPTKAGLGED